jgi:ribosome-associated heat shock protein Hsp15
VDKWLHHVRLFKTRSLAAQACGKSQVRVQGQVVKPSRLVRLHDSIEVDRGALTLVLKVVGLPSARVGAVRVPEFCEDLTPASDYEAEKERRKQEALRNPRPHEAALKPTKKQMRQLHEWWATEDSGPPAPAS